MSAARKEPKFRSWRNPTISDQKNPGCEPRQLRQVVRRVWATRSSEEAWFGERQWDWVGRTLMAMGER